MASGVTIGGTDPDELFEPRGSATPIPVTGWTIGGQDVAFRWKGSEGPEDRLPSATPVMLGSLNLQEMFAAKVTATAPTITGQPDDVTKTEGQDATFSITATGATSYQWQKYNGSSWDDLSGETSNSLTIEGVEESDGGIYRCVATNSAGSTPSDSATLTVDEIDPPVITDHPDSQTVYNGESTTLSVTATGVGPFSYQWQYKYAALDWSDVGTDSSTHNTGPVHSSPGVGAGTYRCLVTNAGGTTPSNEAVVSWASAGPSIDNYGPITTTVDENDEVEFWVDASGKPSLSYQWQYREDSGDSWGDISGATSSSYTIGSAALSDVGQYRCVVTNGNGNSVNSSAMTLNVTPLPTITITSHPTSVTKLEDASHTFTVSATGSGTLTYQWFRNVGSDPEPISGETSNSLLLTFLDDGDEGTYWCVVSNGIDDVPSGSATLTVIMDPIVSTPSDRVADHGDDVTFTVTVSGEGGPFTRQWYHNGVPVGSDSNSLTLNNVEEDDEGIVEVRVTNSYGGSTLRAAELTVNAFVNTPPQITGIGVSPSSGPIGTPVTVTFTATDVDGNMNAWTVRHVGFGAINPGGEGASPNSGSSLNKSFSYEIPSGVGSVEEFRFEVGDSAGGSDGPESTYFIVTP